jgi:hypothetical protein
MFNVPTNKKRSKRKNIIPQMFDVRLVDENGDFDLDKMTQGEKVVNVLPKESVIDSNRKIGELFSDIKNPQLVANELQKFQEFQEDDERNEVGIYQLGRRYPSDEVPFFYETESEIDDSSVGSTFDPEINKNQVERVESPENYYFNEYDYGEVYNQDNSLIAEKKEKLREYYYINKIIQFKENLFTQDYFFMRKRFVFSFAAAACVIFLIFSGVNFVKKGFQIKDLVLAKGKIAYIDLAQAKDEILSKNFQSSQLKFNEAYSRFDEISKDLNDWGGALVNVGRFIPYVSKISSGAALAQAGKDVSQIGVLVGQIMATMDDLKNPLSQTVNPSENPVSLLKLFQDTNNNVQKIQTLLADAQDNIGRVNIEDIPQEQRVQFVDLKNKIPETNKFLAEFASNGQIFTDVLGGNGPRKYLFLFQNNQEMRPTGGFIGTYGVLNIFNGRIDKFFIDGIFNPDGQLREKVVPPVPIQKISAAWSLHDSNWFPNFPTSAEKATWFYEKTGGPTVDGVITMTPIVMQKLLEITGPIDLPDYGVVVDKDNFVEKVQQEAEVDYDKELNQPKKILADLAPKILDRIFNAKNFSDIAKTMNIFVESLNEKQILIYSKNYDIEKELSNLGWSGEILNTQKDYLSVINTNINGYKTDGVIDEKIEHVSEIQEDGSVVDTVTVTRHHNGGETPYEWWNKVNADYMRVYVPKGSRLVSVEGQTREFDSPPLDYDALGFKRDSQVRMEEDSIKIDEASGTRIYDDSEKTVFANWVYVSPQETTTVKYKYLLPFKVDLSDKNNPMDTFSLLVQKQSGSLGSQFISNISYPENFKVNWKYPDNLTQDKNSLKIETDLKTDKFIGIAFTK